jgi:tripartite-type tricarboxylate transporter receptor subunit TctC
MLRFLQWHHGLRWLSRVFLAGSLGLAASAGAQGWPAKPIRLLVPFTPGGVTDTSGRLIAEQLTKRLGQQVVVDNKPGASGNIGTQQVANAEPDGYTLLLGFDGTLVINPHVFPKVGFDTLKDLSPIGKIGDATLILVSNPQFKAKTLREVIEASKADPNGLSYGTSGTGGTPHIAGELLRQRTGAKLTHIPYKGGGQAMTDVLGGNIPLVYTAVAGAIGHIKTGQLHPVAVSSQRRSPSLPDVPTFIESGVPDFEISSWVGLLGPARLPQAIVTRLNTELQAVLNDPQVREKLAVMGIVATPGTPQQFADQIKNDLQRYEGVVKAAGIRLE